MTELSLMSTVELGGYNMSCQVDMKFFASTTSLLTYYVPSEAKQAHFCNQDGITHWRIMFTLLGNLSKHYFGHLIFTFCDPLTLCKTREINCGVIKKLAKLIYEN